MKIVVNRCFGGFGVSNKAKYEIGKRKGMNINFYEEIMSGSYDVIGFKKVDIENDGWGAITVDGDFGDKATNDQIYENVVLCDYNMDRTDKDLVYVVETIGEEADGNCASLEVVEIPDGVKWFIDDYDGIETIHEQHRSW